MSAQPLTPSTRTNAPRRPRGRTLHLVDIENLVVGHPTYGNLERAWTAYQQMVTISPGDQVRIACARSLAAKVGFTIATRRQLLVAGSGHNAAVRALIDSVDIAFTANRFDAVVIASTNGVFANLIAALAGAGCPVTAVHHRANRCSATLLLATTTQRSLDYPLIYR